MRVIDSKYHDKLTEPLTALGKLWVFLLRAAGAIVGITWVMERECTRWSLSHTLPFVICFVTLGGTQN
jgi:hypothetical protein